MPAACGCFRQAPEHHFGIASEILRRDAPQDRHPWWGLLLTITAPSPCFSEVLHPRITNHKSRIADLHGPRRGHFASSDCSLAFTRNGSLNSVISPQPLPRTGRRRAESGLCHFTARLAMSPIISESCSALTSPGSGTVSSPVPHTAE